MTSPGRSGAVAKSDYTVDTLRLSAYFRSSVVGSEEGDRVTTERARERISGMDRLSGSPLHRHTAVGRTYKPPGPS